MPVAHLNNTELFYVEVGEGLPRLVMHGGLGGDHSALHPWLDPLGDVMRLVYYDHRGNGRSGRPPSETITFEQLCADADFWAELAQAYPKAKVLLTLRDPNRWYDSACRAFGSVPTVDTSTAGRRLLSKALGLLLPRVWGRSRRFAVVRILRLGVLA